MRIFATDAADALYLFGDIDFLTVVLKEIVTEDEADSEQQFDVDILAFEYIVNVRPLTIEFAGEPCDASFLPAEFGFDEFSDLYHRPCDEKAWTASCLSRLLGSRIAHS